MKHDRPLAILGSTPAKKCSRLWGLLAWLLVLNLPALAYLVGPPLDLAKLTAEADVIFKGKAVATVPVTDAWFQPVDDFAARETEFKVISVIKGDAPGGKLPFRHYDENSQQRGRMYEPQFYHFEVGRTYVVFAKRSEVAGHFRQIALHHTGKQDQGVLRCADDKPVASTGIKDVLWSEIGALLQSPEAKDAIYGLQQLDEMSGRSGAFSATKDFDRMEALKTAGPLMKSDHEDVARAAITMIGCANPYLSDDSAPYWLGTVGAAGNPGLVQLDPNLINTGGELFQADLIALAKSAAPAATRALAIRALGRVQAPAVAESVPAWAKDAEPLVRAAAALLLADFPGEATLPQISALAADPAAEVRQNAAYTIGFQQAAKLADTLDKLLADADPKVRFAASQSLLSFSPKDAAIAAIFRKNQPNEEFYPLFLLALARDNPQDFLEPLAKVVEGQPEPKNWRGGQVPSYTAFNLLFKYLQAQPAADVRAGKYDRYLDAMEKGYVTGSSEPRDIYAFYLQREMTERAKKYRATASKAAGYDLEYYFKQVDQSPGNYTR